MTFWVLVLVGSLAHRRPVHSWSKFTCAGRGPRRVSSSQTCPGKRVPVSSHARTVRVTRTDRARVSDRSARSRSQSHLFVATRSSEWRLTKMTSIQLEVLQGPAMASPARVVLLAPSWGRATAKAHRVPPTGSRQACQHSGLGKETLERCVFGGQIL